MLTISNKRLLQLGLPLLICVLVLVLFIDKNHNLLNDRLVIGRTNDSLSLDPAITSDSESFQVTANIFETLVSLDKTGNNISPGLAESWKVSEDGLTWQFKIRKNVKFHDGSKLDAHVVAFNFMRWMDPNSPYHTGEFIYYTYSFGGFPGIIKNVTALSDTTLEIILTEPYAPFLNTISMPAFGIASQSAIVKYNDTMKVHPVGTGPFMFDSWQPNEKIILKRFDHYWGSSAKVGILEFQVIPENSDKIALLNNGDIHIIDQLNVSEMDDVNDNDDLRLYFRPFFNIGYLALNNSTQPFDDVRIRKAISLLIDKTILLDDSYNDLVRPANSFLPPVIDGYHEGLKSDAVDVEAAKALLSEAGYPEGFDVSLWVMDRPRNYLPKPIAMASSIKNQLEAAGIKVIIEVIPWDSYIEDVKLGNHQMALVGWNGDIVDPDNFLYTLFASEPVKPELNFNYAFYKNEQVERLLSQARRVTDNGFRINLYREMQEIIANDVASIPLIHTMTAIGTRTDVMGFEPHITGFGTLAEVSIKP